MHNKLNMHTRKSLHNTGCIIKECNLLAVIYIPYIVSNKSLFFDVTVISKVI